MNDQKLLENLSRQLVELLREGYFSVVQLSIYTAVVEDPLLQDVANSFKRINLALERKIHELLDAVDFKEEVSTVVQLSNEVSALVFQARIQELNLHIVASNSGSVTQSQRDVFYVICTALYTIIELMQDNIASGLKQFS